MTNPGDVAPSVARGGGGAAAAVASSDVVVGKTYTSSLCRTWYGKTMVELVLPSRPRG